MGQVKGYMMEALAENPSLKAEYDALAAAVLEGRAQVRLSEKFSFEVFHAGETEIMSHYLLSYYLWQLDTAGFSFEKARDFAEKLRAIFGFSAKGWGTPLLDALEEWVHCNLRDPYFYNAQDTDDPAQYYRENWLLKEGGPRPAVHEDLFKFACYAAVCFLKYGASYHCVTANRIFGFVTAMGSGLPDRMKKHGSGEMPKELLSCEDAGLSCKANDAFATIKITVKEEAEGHYAKALDFLIRLLPAGFPRSYGIEFKSPDKNYLAVKGLPKKSVNQFFANAARYESLHGKIAHYAKSAMRQFEQYTNLGDEECAMPGSFAVFAIGLCDAADTPHAPLVIEYFKLCDDEHSSIQGKFLAAYIAKFGLSEKTLDVFFAGIDSMQEQGPQYSKVYAEAFANEASLRLLLSRKKDFDDCRWNKVLHSIFGREALAGGGTGVVKKAPAGLRALYGEIFA